MMPQLFVEFRLKAKLWQKKCFIADDGIGK
jgi:hypothetical protein